MLGWRGPITHRQFLGWQEWRDSLQYWNSPDRHDHYLMQVAREVYYVLASKRDGSLNDFRIVFKDPEPQVVMTKEERLRAETKLTKQAWGARLGITIPHKP